MIRIEAVRPYGSQNGSAALEVLLLLPFILLIFALLFNMGYNADRRNKTQAALRIGGYHYVSGLANQSKTQAEQATEALVNDQIFPGETSAADLSYSNSDQKPADLKDDQGLLGNASFRITVRAEVTRSAPYPSLVNNNSMTAEYVVSANTWTFCELKDEDFSGPGSAALNGGALVGNYVLWLFGGCGGDTYSFRCSNRCP